MLTLGVGLAGAHAPSASAQIITEYPIPSADTYPADIVVGPDGNLWFTEQGANSIGRIQPDGSIDEFPVSSCCGPPLMITAGPDGYLWFTVFTADDAPGRIGRVSINGVATEFQLPGMTGPSFGITSGPDGNLWLTEGPSNKVARITPNLVVTEFPVPTADSSPSGITAGPDGNLWFTELFGNRIGRITPSGAITEFEVPTADSQPSGIAAGPDGNLWFTESAKIGRITTNGSISEFLSDLDLPSEITAGQDGNLWFTEFFANRVWRLTIDGVGTPYSVPTPNSSPLAIASYPDGAIWFTEYDRNKIGRIQTPGVSSILPSSGPASGGTAVVVVGTLFQPGATLTIGGEAAANIVVSSPEEIDAATPALSPGTLNTVVVTNPDEGGTGDLAQGFFADFLDVPQGDIFHGYVEKIFRRGITAGCGQGDFCRNVPVYRAPMAVFLLKAEHGAGYVPPACTGIFADLVCPGNFADWVEQLHAEGITGGCGGGNYCPSDKVTRAQMSAFLLKTKHGPSHVPPPCTGIFDDVECPSLFADWIEELYAEGITGGCSIDPPLYCPGSFSTRGQMAVFLVKTFNLP